jgi:hypothetical protein
MFNQFKCHLKDNGTLKSNVLVVIKFILKKLLYQLHNGLKLSNNVILMGIIEVNYISKCKDCSRKGTISITSNSPYIVSVDEYGVIHNAIA